MKLIDRFLSSFIPKRRRGRRRPYWTTSPFPKKVKEMVKLSETEARTQSVKLLEVLLKIHRDTNFSECKADDNLLGLISNLMNGIEVEKRTVEEITLKLYQRYAKELFNKILEFVEWEEDTYINFDHTSEILNRAKRVMGNTQIKQADLTCIIKEMNEEYQRLEDKEDRNETKSFRNFITMLLVLWGIEAGVLGAVTFRTETFSVVNTFAYFYGIAFTTGIIFSRFYKLFLIVGKRKIFRKHRYFEEEETF